ncbi:hypothetical protein CFC21_015667 [Triticum aestivum]|uniref:Uncharacterized protein n=3 Tax=Triticum TaxID=4564 RepID=A0A9R1NLJ4_TRITD|nr:uncharacterized protein LOC119353494 [Triticum dicoccoides]XP_044455520.1 uncharacterized protein LOC123187666 [Triticum aestivum]XP_048554905.1 uncharacterized protein LOC125535882 [Triticum urartu]KAF6999680.1 hypothetical protein CFC21_015667 [Triticum aestivum]VAH27098.1 unnamed protein product [Triticum turgidum subsp. durum]
MALRSLLTKVPALGLRSRGPVHALSPPPAARLLSSGGPGGQIISEGSPTTIYSEEVKALETDCERLQEKIHRDMDSFSELLRSDAEYYRRLTKQLKMVDTACGAAIVLGVSAAVFMTVI